MEYQIHKNTIPNTTFFGKWTIVEYLPCGLHSSPVGVIFNANTLKECKAYAEENSIEIAWIDRAIQRKRK